MAGRHGDEERKIRYRVKVFSPCPRVSVSF
jgi:hypothetical protein